MRELFTRLAALDEDGQATGVPPQALREILVPELLSDAHVMAAGAFQLSELERDRIIGLQRRSTWMLLAIVTGLTLAVALVSGLTYRGVIRGLASVYTGAHRIREGDLGHRVGLDSRDEIAEVSRAIDTMAAELERAQEEVVRNARLAVIGQLAGGVSHELRNPIAVMRNAVYYLGLIVPSDDRVRKHLEILNREIAAATGIITGMLDYARMTQPNGTRTDLNAMARAGLQRVALPDSVAVVLALTEDLPAVSVDPEQMVIVVGNLVLNAAQAMPRGGTLTIETRSVAHDGAGAELVVADTGMGISPEHLPRIFEPLYSTKAKGIGLGLAVAKNLVEVNGGSISAESTAGRGARFVVRVGGPSA